MGGGRARQRLEIVAALEQRHDAPVGLLSGDLHDLPRRPGEIGLDEVDVAERIAAVGVEAGGDDDEIGRERLDARQDGGLHRLAERLAPVARP